MKALWELFIAFLKTGTFGFGGGQASMSIVKAEVVDNLGIITEEQFADFYAIGNTLPGPIAPKMSVIIGYSQEGFLGAAVSLLGVLLPSTILIILLFSFFMANKDHPVVKGMQVAVKPVVVALIFGVAFSIARSTVFVNIDFTTSRTIIVFALFFVASGLVLANELVPGFNVHPAIIIVCALLIGGAFIR